MSTHPPADSIQIPELLPLLPLADVVVFPHVIVPVVINEPRQVELINQALSSNKLVGVFSKKSAEEGESEEARFYKTGCAAAILKMFKMPDGGMGLLLQGMRRISLREFLQRDPYLKARVRLENEDERTSLKIEALRKDLKRKFQILTEDSHSVREEIRNAIVEISDAGKLADVIASNLNITVEERQEILEAVQVEDRLIKVLQLVQRDIEMSELSRTIKKRVDSEIESSQKEHYLREQIRMIQRELGDDDDQNAELDALLKQARQKGMNGLALAAVEKEISKMRRIHVSSPDYHISRTYVDWLLELPWGETEETDIDIVRAAEILDRDHFGLQEVKDRILEFLSVKQLNPETRSPIICLAGPPGVGKTSLGRSIAEALGRRFVRIALGGVRDEAEIRGHRKTYVGAFPGRIIQKIREAQVVNPVFMLDEVDKLGADVKGDPASALLEVLDPEQNNSFTDHYLDVPFDLSKVLFITTANQPYEIPAPLLDRMEVIQLSGYLQEEKYQIARRYLLPRQIRNNGLPARVLTARKNGIVKIIDEYTREAGVRELEQRLGQVCRRVARNYLEKNIKRVTLNPESVQELLGMPRFAAQHLKRKRGEVGVVTGLAWTPYGGDVLSIETVRMAGGQRKLQLTGQLGEVMRESALTAMSYLRAHGDRYGIATASWDDWDLHIHIPAGATPKDGPSAGITLAVALVSLITGRPVSRTIAMTGEITLTGKVMPIGGLREKLLAARSNRIKIVLIPADNHSDLMEVPDYARRNLDIRLVDTLDDVMKNVFP